MSITLRILHWLCRCLLGGIFVYSGYVKAQATLQFAVAITGYKLVPDNLVFPLATYLPWIEMALGLVLLSGWKIRYVATGSACLLLFFIVILTVTYLRGIDASCGCFSLNERISPKTIARDGLFLLPAIYLIIEDRLRIRRKDSSLSFSS